MVEAARRIRTSMALSVSRTMAPANLPAPTFFLVVGIDTDFGAGFVHKTQLAAGALFHGFNDPLARKIVGRLPVDLEQRQADVWDRRHGWVWFLKSPSLASHLKFPSWVVYFPH